MPVLRLLDTGSARGSFNMALDEALYRRALEGKTPPTLRFYSWSPPAVSLGYFQSWDREFDSVRCREEGVEIYRRITGGRAVLHGDEVTYSVVAGRIPGAVGKGVLPVYLKISEALASGLRRLGLKVSLASTPPRTTCVDSSHHPVCFSSATGYEITFGGKKIVGSALKRHGDAFLQHGSILLASHGEELGRLLKERYRRVPEGAFVTGLRDLLGDGLSYGGVVEAMAAGFAEAWETGLVPADPSDEELSLAAELERDRYLSPDWNLRCRAAC